MKKLENVIIREISFEETPIEIFMGKRFGFIGKYYQKFNEETPKNKTSIILYNVDQSIALFGEILISDKQILNGQEIEYLVLSSLTKKEAYAFIEKLEYL